MTNPGNKDTGYVYAPYMPRYTLPNDFQFIEPPKGSGDTMENVVLRNHSRLLQNLSYQLAYGTKLVSPSLLGTIMDETCKREPCPRCGDTGFIQLVFNKVPCDCGIYERLVEAVDSSRVSESLDIVNKADKVLSIAPNLDEPRFMPSLSDQILELTNENMDLKKQLEKYGRDGWLSGKAVAEINDTWNGVYTEARQHGVKLEKELSLAKQDLFAQKKAVDELRQQKEHIIQQSNLLQIELDKERKLKNDLTNGWNTRYQEMAAELQQTKTKYEDICVKYHKIKAERDNPVCTIQEVKIDGMTLRDAAGVYTTGYPPKKSNPKKPPVYTIQQEAKNIPKWLNMSEKILKDIKTNSDPLDGGTSIDAQFRRYWATLSPDQRVTYLREAGVHPAAALDYRHIRPNCLPWPNSMTYQKAVDHYDRCKKMGC